MKAHGTYKLDVKNNTITFVAYDSWNYEAAVVWGEELKNVVIQMNKEPWSCLVELTKWELITPDARSYISELYSWLNTQNLKYLAVVFGSSLQRALLEKTYVILTNVEIKYCEDLEEAKSWLSDVGF